MNTRGALDSDVAAVGNWFRAQGGLDERFGAVFRQAIDEVLDGQRTGRFDVRDLAKTEKTYLGTKVEILVQHEFGLLRGTTLDYRIANVEFDAKWSARLGGWMIPTEAVGHLCLCMTADDVKSTFSVGLLRAAEDLLRLGANKDAKRSLSASSLIEIEWLVQNGHLPENFLLHLDQVERAVGGVVPALAHESPSWLCSQAPRGYDSYARVVRVGRTIHTAGAGIR